MKLFPGKHGIAVGLQFDDVSGEVETGDVGLQPFRRIGAGRQWIFAPFGFGELAQRAEIFCEFVAIDGHLDALFCNPICTPSITIVVLPCAALENRIEPWRIRRTLAKPICEAS